MDSRAALRLERYRYQPLEIALAYRWASLVVSLLVALFATSPLEAGRNALLAPIGMAAIVSGVVLRWPSARWLPVALGAEVAVAAVAIWITGHYDSPLLLYLTAPVIHAAIMRDPWLVAGLSVLAVALFLGVVAIDPAAFAVRPGGAIRNVALLIMLPLLVLAVASGTRPAPASHRIQDEDLAIARELALGHTYKEMGEALDMSPEAIKVHVARLYRRVGAASRDEAVTAIDDLGLLRHEGERTPELAVPPSHRRGA